MNLERKEGETENQYIWRIGQMIDAGQIDNWKTIAPILNKQLRNDETEYRDESAYRKNINMQRCSMKMYSQKEKVMNIYKNLKSKK